MNQSKTINTNNIPAELQQTPQWVVWCWEERDGEPTKPLLRADQPFFEGRRRYAKTTDSKTWSDLPTAISCLYRNQDHIAGIGFVFTERDPYCGIDLDDCRDPGSGVINEWAWEQIRRLDSYSEISPSGTGVKIICKAKLHGECKKTERAEIYDRTRYFTVTGNTLDGYTTIHTRQKEVDAFYGDPSIFPPKPKTDAQAVNAKPAQAGDAEIIDKVRATGDSNKLWAGDLSSHGGDHSKADLALCNLLAFYCGPDQDRISRLFAQSGLMREKWNRQDYQDRTIGLALADRQDYYQWPTDDLRTMETQLGTWEAKKTLEELTGTSSPTERKKHGFRRERIFHMPNPTWQIAGHLPEESLVTLVGPSGVCKSFVALDYSICVASGKPYLGTYDTKQGAVMYIASEGGYSIKKRILAWEKHNKQQMPANMVVVPHVFDLLAAQERADILQIAIEDLQASPSLVVIDTLNRNFGGDENSTQDMTAFVRTCDYLRITFHATILIVHHTGKDRTRKERGNSVLRAACDTLIFMDESDGKKAALVTCDKQKDAPEFESYLLRKKVIDLGDDETSLVLEGQNQTRTRYDLLRRESKEFLGSLWDTFQTRPFSPADAIAKKCATQSATYRQVGVLCDKHLLTRVDTTYYIPSTTANVIYCR